MRLLLPFMLAALVFGCGESETTGTGGTGGTGGTANGCDDSRTFEADPPLVVNEERPADVFVPTDYDPAGCYPLVILLHGFGADGMFEDAYLGTSNLVDDKQYVLVTPDGTMSMGDTGPRFWNADPNGESEVDDLGYVVSLINEAKETYNVDHDRVYLFGHSNGGFMSFYLTCEASENFAGFANLAGSTFVPAEDCETVNPRVSILSIHGTADDTVPYDGEENYPGALEYTERFALAMGCTDVVEDGPRLDLNFDLPADEELPPEDTSVLRYTDCPESIDVELWTMEDGLHIPLAFSPDFTPMVLDWLFAHPRLAE